LRELMEAAAGSGGVADIHAIGGMAGIGKTAFAVHAAHLLAPSFPAGQIFLPLHGHTPGHRSVDPADALASLLLTVGVAVTQIPPGLEARMALWRDRLAGKQLLLLLDDAADSEQVRPLLPGTAGSLVLVTSRRHLTALEDARVISLDTLPPEEAARLLVRLAARPYLEAGDAAVGEITRLCGYLPLAVGMLARQLHHHPAWTPADLAADLAASRSRLELMTTENLSVTAAFDLSYQDLTEGQQQMFRRLGLHPGVDIDGYASAALGGVAVATARRCLDILYDQYLLTEPARGRYRLHDLIREHAGTLAANDPPDETDAAIDRLLNYYLHTTRIAGHHLAWRTTTRIPGSETTPPMHAPDLSARENAVRWLETERLNLHAAADYAAIAERPGYVIGISAAMHDFLRVQGHWGQALVLHNAARISAFQANDLFGQACALKDLGSIQRRTGDYQAAAISLGQALQFFMDLGDRLGCADTLMDLGAVQRSIGDYTSAIVRLTSALEEFQRLNDRFGQAAVLNHLGQVQYNINDYPAAIASLERAIDLSRNLGYVSGQSNALSSLALVQRAMGDYSAVIVTTQHALELARSMGDRHAQVAALNTMALALLATGQYEASSDTFTQILHECREMGNRHGQAAALINLADAQTAMTDYTAATASLDQALPLTRDLGDRRTQAQALNSLGIARWKSGNPDAKVSLEQALALYQEIRDRRGQAETLNNLAEVSGASATAQTFGEQALMIARDIAALPEEARALEAIGLSLLNSGQAGKACTFLRQALEIYQQTGSPAADHVRDILRDHCI
jgi:tetratricopeptide (TPR) repeat protein